MWRRTDLASYRSGSPQWETVLSVDALNRAEGESWVYKGHTVYRPRDGSPPTRTLLELSRGGADAVVLRCADTHVSRGPSVLYVLYLLYGPRVPASRVLYAPAVRTGLGRAVRTAYLGTTGAARVRHRAQALRAAERGRLRRARGEDAG